MSIVNVLDDVIVIPKYFMESTHCNDLSYSGRKSANVNQTAEFCILWDHSVGELPPARQKSGGMPSGGG